MSPPEKKNGPEPGAPTLAGSGGGGGSGPPWKKEPSQEKRGKMSCWGFKMNFLQNSQTRIVKKWSVTSQSDNQNMIFSFSILLTHQRHTFNYFFLPVSRKFLNEFLSYETLIELIQKNFFLNLALVKLKKRWMHISSYLRDLLKFYVNF